MTVMEILHAVRYLYYYRGNWPLANLWLDQWLELRLEERDHCRRGALAQHDEDVLAFEEVGCSCPPTGCTGICHLKGSMCVWCVGV